MRPFRGLPGDEFLLGGRSSSSCRRRKYDPQPSHGTVSTAQLRMEPRFLDIEWSTWKAPWWWKPVFPSMIQR